MKHRFAAVRLIGLIVAATHLCGCGARTHSPNVQDAWAPATPPMATVAAIYMTIETAADDVLLGASTPVAGEVQIHTTTHNDGMAHMRPVGRVELPAGKAVEFSPGGLHFMVVGLQAPLVAGSTLQVELQLQRAGRHTLDVPVIAPTERIR